MRYLRTFLKRWYLYIIPVLVLPVVVTAYGYKTLLSYQCSALLWVDKPVYLSAQDFGWSQWLSPAQNEATAMNELLQSETFITSVAQRTDLANTMDLSTQAGKTAAFYRISGEVTIYATGVGPHTLLVTVTDKDPRMALQIINAMMTAYTAEYQANRLQLDQQGITYYQQQAASMSGVVTQDTQKVQDYLNAHPGINPNVATNTDPYLARLEAQLHQDQQNLDNENAEIANLRQDMQITDVASSNLFRVTNQPVLPTSPTISKKSLIMTYTGGGLGAALGLVGLIVAVLTRLDRKVYAKRDLTVIVEDLELELPAIEALPIISGIGRPKRKHGKHPDDNIDGMLNPMLAVLPRPRTPEIELGARRPAQAPVALPSGMSWEE